MDLQNFLTTNKIEFILHQHPAVFSSEEVIKNFVNVPGVVCKNLFLCDKKGQKFFLLIIPLYKKADLKRFAKLVDVNKVTFASHVLLKEKLGLNPGSVSPTGILHDKKAEVAIYIDRELYDSERVNFHPDINTASLELSKDMFHKFLQATKRQYNVIDL